MSTTIYTAVKYDWDGVANEFVVKEQVGYEYRGPILYAKKALKKLSKSFLGKIVMAVATYYAGPLLGEAVFGGSSVLGTAAAGAIAGGISGGWKGAMLGGIAGGIGGQLSSGTTGLDPSAAGGSAFVGPDISLASPAVQAAQSAAPAASAVTTGGAEVGLNYGGISPEEAGGAFYNNAPTSGGFEGAAVAQQGGSSLDSTVTAQGGGQDYLPGYNQNGEWTGKDASGDSIFQNADGTSKIAAGGQASPGLDLNWKGMAMEGGKALLSSALNPKPDMGAYNDYLDSMTQSNKDVTAFNKDMAGKKAAIGDQLTTDAIAMNPDYYAEQRRRGQAFADANSWADQKASLELRGTNAQGIQAEQNRNDLFSSLRQGSAYDQGWQTGMNSRNATFGTAGSMYTQMSYPQDTTGSGYSKAYDMSRQGSQDTGKLLENVYQVGTGEKKPGVKRTDAYGNEITS